MREPDATYTTNSSGARLPARLLDRLRRYRARPVGAAQPPHGPKQRLLVEQLPLVTYVEAATTDGTALHPSRQVEALLGSGSGGVGDGFENVFNQLVQLTSRPDDAAARRPVISAAADLAERFNATAGEIDRFRSEFATQISQTVNEVNDFATRIADLNVKIANQVQAGGQPNDLIDQRDQLIDRLLTTPAYKARWTYFFGDLFKSAANRVGNEGKNVFYRWLYDNIHLDRPYHLLVQQLFALLFERSGEVTEADYLSLFGRVPGLAEALDAGWSDIREHLVAGGWMTCTGTPSCSANVVRSASCRHASPSTLARRAPASSAPRRRSAQGML